MAALPGKRGPIPSLLLASCGLLLATVLVAARRPSPALLVALKFVPQERVGSSSVALPASVLDRAVDIRVQDAREAADPRIVGTGTNDDDLPFPIRATTDVNQFVGEAVAQLATAQALKKGSSARVLQLRL